MLWYRITLDRAGAVLDCTEVEERNRASRTVVYIAAESAREACVGAVAWYARRLEKQRARVSRNYYAAKADGRCQRCHKKKPLETQQHCAECRAIHRETCRRSRAGLTRKIRQTPEVALAKVKKDNRVKYARNLLQGRNGYVQTLERILAEFRAREAEDFEQWLEGKIAEMTSKVIARNGGRARAYLAEVGAAETAGERRVAAMR